MIYLLLAEDLVGSDMQQLGRGVLIRIGLEAVHESEPVPIGSCASTRKATAPCRSKFKNRYMHMRRLPIGGPDPVHQHAQLHSINFAIGSLRQGKSERGAAIAHRPKPTCMGSFSFPFLF